MSTLPIRYERQLPDGSVKVFGQPVCVVLDADPVEGRLDTKGDDPTAIELYGRVLCGLEPNTPLY